MDPLLRQTIWRHLIKISRTTTTTIIITTHYVEEARQANRVGMMRFGRLLAEDSPAALIETYQQTNLENVFLSLCLNTGHDEPDGPGSVEAVVVPEDPASPQSPGTKSQSLPMKEKQAPVVRKERHQHEKIFCFPPRNFSFARSKEKIVFSEMSILMFSNIRSSTGEDTPSDVCYDLLKWTRFKALLVKNFIRMWRNLGFLVFQFIIPTVQVSLFCLAIGRDPKGMTVAVVNEEVAGGCVSWSEGCLLASQDLDFNSGDDEGWTDWDVTEPQDLYQVIISSL